MRDVLPEVTEWLANDERVALATVVRTWGSSPRGVGAKMALTPGGEIAGSVSGGCVEGAVYETGVQVLKSRVPQLLEFGVADETAWEVGLACGGQIEVFVEPLEREDFNALRIAMETERLYAVASLVSGPQTLLGSHMLVTDAGFSGSLESGLAAQVVEKARQALESGHSQRFNLDWQGESLDLFVEVVKPPPQLIMVGGVHIAIALASLARVLGFRSVVVDPRRAFGSEQRFPHIDRLVQAWPDEAFAQLRIDADTAIAMLTHDPKIDDPALMVALRSPAFYVGALGSQKTQAKRRSRLLQAGLSQDELDRLHGPIGLPIGGETPEEIALAVMAEVVAAYRKRED